MNLPDDIVDEILLLLPVNSLGRFRVVCKDWYSHIHSKSFIAKHIKNQRGKEKILIYHRQYRKINYAISICSEEEKQVDDDEEEEEEDGDDIRTLFHTTKQQQYFIKHMPFEHLKDSRYIVKVDIIGTVNGIVCFAYTKWIRNYPTFDKIITLWNPTTREFNTLPPFQLQRPPPGNRMYSDRVGFGFDCTTDDYKVIQISFFGNWLKEKYIIQMKIYTLSTNSWREFDCSGLSDIVITPARLISTLFGNKLCWLASNIGFKINEWFFLSFDMGREVFRKIPLPSEYVQFVGKGYITRIFHTHDSIALLLYRGSGTAFQIWTTKDLEQGFSWIKLSSVGIISGIERPLGFWKCKNNNDFLFLFTYSNAIKRNAIKGIYMNNQDQVKNNRLVTVKVKDNSIAFPKQALTYIETLVSVNRS